MITRIVRLEFQPEKVTSFIQLFESSYPHILNFDGCEEVELHRDINHPNVFYTKSIWKSSEDLENYRSSDFFQKTWGITKTFFCGKPQAFSLEKLS